MSGPVSFPESHRLYLSSHVPVLKRLADVFFHRCKFMIKAPEGRVEELATKIDEAAKQIRELLECT